MYYDTKDVLYLAVFCCMRYQAMIRVIEASLSFTTLNTLTRVILTSLLNN